MQLHIFCAVGLLASFLTSISQAQELLTNPGFELPAVTTPCVRDTQAITGWTTGGPDRNDTQFTPACPRVPGDTAYISKQANGPTPAARVIRQTVNGLTAGTSYTFTGYWAFGVENADGTITAAAELHDGTDFQATAPPASHRPKHRFAEQRFC